MKQRRVRALWWPEGEDNPFVCPPPNERTITVFEADEAPVLLDHRGDPIRKPKQPIGFR